VKIGEGSENVITYVRDRATSLPPARARTLTIGTSHVGFVHDADC
jgi:hypothetical protein